MTKRSKISLILVAVMMVSGLILVSSPSLADQTGGASEGKTVGILIQGFAFSPSNLNIVKGTTVVWTNYDRMTYKVKSEKFESGELNRGDSFNYTFNETGTYDYSEVSIPSMKGTITVT